MKFFSFTLFALVASASCEEKTVADKKKLGTIIGIDLGTTYSRVGVFKNGRVEIIANEQGNKNTPSYVAFSGEQGQRLIGDAAKDQLTINPENTIFNVKRLIGRFYNDTTVQDDIEHWPFKIVDKANKPNVEVKVGSESKQFAPEEVSAMVLVKMKQIAESYLGHKVSNAVITVPAYFNNAQRQATKDAGAIAGLNVVRIMNEPTAAAIAYGLDQKGGKRNIIVFDLGGGTFDVSLLTVYNGVFEVLASNGDTHLGGEDFDQRVMEYFFELYKEKSGNDLRKDNRAVEKLRLGVEKAKRALSTQHQTTIEIASLYDGADFSGTLTLAKFEELNMDFFRDTIKPVREVLKDAGMKKTDIHEIVLVGGSTRIPKVQQLIKKFFNGKEPYRGINPDEAVVYGAAMQGGVMGSVENAGDVVLRDVNPFTVGVENFDGLMIPLISRKTVIPAKGSQVFSTSADGQISVTVVVYEGERIIAKDNHKLGVYDFSRISPAPRHVPQINVTLEIDVNGIFHVSAEDKITGNKLASDQAIREKVDSRIVFYSYAYQMKSLIDDMVQIIYNLYSAGGQEEKSSAEQAEAHDEF